MVEVIGYLIYLIGLIVVTLIVAYALFYVMYLVLRLQAEPVIQPNSMPSLKPIPIPTKNQRTPIHRLVTFIFEVRKWELMENWHYNLSNEKELIIPKGFRFDGASIPRPFWGILSPVGLLLIPGLLHDYGYKHDQIWEIGAGGSLVTYGEDEGKDFWDQLFLSVANEVNGVILLNLIAWIAVTIGGRKTWERHKQEREKGLKATKPVLS